ncbi:MAG: hypothetical protein Tp1123DCM1511741_26 [Prokaryotic dsDNA virus sp.]|nr:MAG: hypothetical protein Tp1123DCM1511741_26 [Prokaryotic dsDNA virus sp.]|tara:strand:- start:74 stop:451 length:378 start_codon:yes stop_codon:yes gene_type:complete
MSFHALSWAIKQDAGNPTSKLVLVILANYADENNTCYPSQEHISKLCHCSRRSVNTHIKQLEKKGFFRIVKCSSGLKVMNRYVLSVTQKPNMKNGLYQREKSSQNTINKLNKIIKKPKNKNFIAG